MLKTLIVTKNQRRAQFLSKKLDGILSSFDIENQIHSLEMIVLNEKIQNEDLILAEAEKKRPHIFVCEIDDEENQAEVHQLVGRIKRKIPKSFAITFTDGDLRSAIYSESLPNPDMIVHTPLVNRAEYAEYIARRILNSLGSISNLNMEWKVTFEKCFDSFRYDDAKKKRVSIEEVSEVIEQCLFNGSVSKSKKKVELTRITGGRSGSVVLGAKLSGELTYGIMGVVKISSRERADKERENYGRYVKWVLPYTWKVELLGIGFSENIGAVCYSFAFDGDGKPISCTEKIKMSDEGVVKFVCNTLLNPEKKTWYAELSRKSVGIGEYFQNRFFKSAKAIRLQEDKFASKMKSLFGENFHARGNTWTLFGKKVKRPNSLIFGEDWGCIEECICHGDLNANNILVNDSGDKIVIIDFQDTGFHHIFRDFISFESSVRLDWGDDIEITNCERYLNAEIDLADRAFPLESGYLGQIYSIRKAAFEKFPLDEGDGRHALYLISAYIHFSWLVTRFDDWNGPGYLRLVIGAFAALAALQKLLGEDN